MGAVSDEASIAELDRVQRAFESWGEDWVYVSVPPDADEILKLYPDADLEVLRRCDELIKRTVTAAYPVTRGALYVHSRNIGNSDTFAAMLAMRRSPGVDTDDVFFSGIHHLGHQMGDDQALNYVNAHIKVTGKKPPEGAMYMPGLARFQGDPQAFVSRSDGRTYIKRLIESRGGKCSRTMDVTWNEPESDPFDNCVPLADDIIESRARQMAATDPSINQMDRRELRQQIIDRHGPSA